MLLMGCNRRQTHKKIKSIHMFTNYEICENLDCRERHYFCETIIFKAPVDPLHEKNLATIMFNWPMRRQQTVLKNFMNTFLNISVEHSVNISDLCGKFCARFLSSLCGLFCKHQCKNDYENSSGDHWAAFFAFDSD